MRKERIQVYAGIKQDTTKTANAATTRFYQFKCVIPCMKIGDHVQHSRDKQERQQAVWG